MIAAVVVLAQLSQASVPLSELLAPFRRYADSGEINSRVTDQHAKIERDRRGAAPRAGRTASTASR